jgi:hypothetical protein
VFTADDLTFLTAIVSDAWLSAADLDWSVPAGTLDWSDRTMELGDDATPESLVESLQMATRVLSALVRDTDPSVRSILFDRLGACQLRHRQDLRPSASRPTSSHVPASS